MLQLLYRSDRCVALIILFIIRCTPVREIILYFLHLYTAISRTSCVHFIIRLYRERTAYRYNIYVLISRDSCSAGR